MASIIIDGREYDIDSLSDEARAQLVSLQFVDAELAKMVNLNAALQTARNAYARALNEALNVPVHQPANLMFGDTIKFV